MICKEVQQEIEKIKKALHTKGELQLTAPINVSYKEGLKKGAELQHVWETKNRMKKLGDVSKFARSIGERDQKEADVIIVEEFPDYSLPELDAYKQKILKALKGVVK